MPTSLTTQNALALLARLLIGWLFIPAGWAKIGSFLAVTGYIAARGVPLPEVCAAIAIVVELGLGVLMVVGWQARWAALGLAAFLAVITPIFHNYWAAPAAQAIMQQQAFAKNMAILGGLLLIAAFGAGEISLRGRERSQGG